MGGTDGTRRMCEHAPTSTFTVATASTLQASSERFYAVHYKADSVDFETVRMHGKGMDNIFILMVNPY